MHKLIISILFCVVLYVSAQPGLEDMQTIAMLAAGQAKDLMENGAAARDGRRIEFMGATYQRDSAIGFGDAMRSRRAIAVDDNSASSSSESEER
ncbi:uncharacterized protein LOC119670742 [Teleopsis dalmanni]|uniref:uncharacterized protein LOC119670742 n=1 Tax=Teleopsis dalmanni TaxID=139649 RepID=UPI0018CEC4C6|nr:uncharacterized protein LOC119670742 [Teleopsis dalmanni]